MHRSSSTCPWSRTSLPEHLRPARCRPTERFRRPPRSASGGGQDAVEHRRGGAPTGGHQQELVQPDGSRNHREPRAHPCGEGRARKGERPRQQEQDPLLRPGPGRAARSGVADAAVAPVREPVRRGRGGPSGRRGRRGWRCRRGRHSANPTRYPLGYCARPRRSQPRPRRRPLGHTPGTHRERRAPRRDGAGVRSPGDQRRLQHPGSAGSYGTPASIGPAGLTSTGPRIPVLFLRRPRRPPGG